MAGSESMQPGTWTVDPVRSEVGFSVRHLMVATVHGRFTSFEGTITSDGTGITAADGFVHTASIDTGEPRRDEHLRAASYFDVERFPRIRFVSTRIDHDHGANRYRIRGELTIQEVTRELELDAVLRTDSADPDLVRLGVHGAISRRAFGISWRDALEVGGAIVSDRVTVALELAARHAGSPVTPALSLASGAVA